MYFSTFEGDSGDELNATTDCFPNGLEGCAKYWFGKDYTNFIVKDFNNLELPYQGIIKATRFRFEKSVYYKF